MFPEFEHSQGCGLANHARDCHSENTLQLLVSSGMHFGSTPTNLSYELCFGSHCEAILAGTGFFSHETR